MGKYKVFSLAFRLKLSKSVLCSPNPLASHLKRFFNLLFSISSSETIYRYPTSPLKSLNNLYRSVAMTIISFPCTEEQLFRRASKRSSLERQLPWRCLHSLCTPSCKQRAVLSPSSPAATALGVLQPQLLCLMMPGNKLLKQLIPKPRKEASWAVENCIY